MPRVRRRHLALYGNVGLLRGNCPECKRVALIVRGEYLCCGMSATDAPPRSVVRMSNPQFSRRGPSVEARRRLLAEQGGCCAWCDRSFGSTVTMGGKCRTLVHRWDHVLPFAFSQDNADANFVAACQYCNGWKSSHVFLTTQEVREYVARKWQAKTGEAVLGMQS